jgi:hypothetical protein
LVGCEEHDGYYHGYHHGPIYGTGFAPGAIHFEWSLAGLGAEGDEDASVSEADGGVDADAAASSAVSDGACTALGASEFQALLFDQGTIVGALQSSCSAGSDGLRVRANDYTATAVLVNDHGVPVTETEAIPAFVVAPGEIQVIHVTFKKLAGAE